MAAGKGARINSSIQIVDGHAGWPLAETLDHVCYPPDVMAKVVWRDVTWAHADKRIFVYDEGEAVCHAGVYLRDGRDGPAAVRIVGVGGVMTLPGARRRGYAGAAMRAAEALMREATCDFGLLFCEPHNIGFYENLGWRIFHGDVFCEQPEGRVRFDIMHAMILPIGSEPASHIIDLCGLPW